jgi:uncharacterized protein
MLAYVIGLFSINIGAPILVFLGVPNDPYIITGIWSVISFTIMLIVILILMKADWRKKVTRDAIDWGKIILWTVIGFFFVLLAQTVAGNIEIYLFGIEPESENTKLLIDIARSTPLFIIVTIFIAPILEEIIFRKIIFGTIYEKYGNFLIAILFSSLLFGILHGEPEHLLRYMGAGIVFAYIYVKTKRIIVPILTHISLNSFVVAIQFLLPPEKMEEILEQYEGIQTIIIGGLLFL